jgi:hypothetical protein
MSRTKPDARATLSQPAATSGLRRIILGTAVVVLVQVGIGMIVNLYEVIPAHHPGSHPSNYFTGSVRSVAWALSHGAAALVIHATLGLALAALAVIVAV